MSKDRDYDVIIVGTGIAGHCAALEALRAGARVLMVDGEKHVGGSSKLSSGILMGADTRFQRRRKVTDDSPERLYQLYMSANQWTVQPSVAKRLCYAAGTTVDWLEDLGIEYLDLIRSGGEDRPRGHITHGGDTIVTTLAGHVGQHDSVDTALNTRVERLTVKGSTVTGIGIGEDKVTAGAVVLATGGMGANLNMVAEWQPAAFWEAGAVPRYIGQASSRGDAIRLGQQVGAQIAKGRGSRSPLWSFGGGYIPGYMLVVNSLAQRFLDETSAYGIAEVLFSNQLGATGYAIFNEDIKKSMRTAKDVAKHMAVLFSDIEGLLPTFTSDGVDDLVKSGQIMRAETLDDLAARIGLPVDNLHGTLERYNELALRGVDEDYLKPPHCLMALSGGPFYAFDIHLPLYGLTAVGVRVDHQASVIHTNSRSIPGLFAAGECTGGVLGTMYVGSGNALANATTYGRIAGRNAAAYALEGSLPPVDWNNLSVL